MSSVTRNSDTNQDEFLKALLANQTSYASLSASNATGLTTALALRYSQTVASYRLNQHYQAPTSTCSACAMLWISGWSCEIRLVPHASLGSHTNKTRNLSKRSKKRRALRAQLRQAKLKVKLKSDKKELITKRISLHDGGLPKFQLACKCLACSFTLLQDVPDVDKNALPSKTSQNNPSSTHSNNAADTPTKKRRPKSKKSNSLSNLMARKEERSKGLSLGLADFLAK